MKALGTRTYDRHLAAAELAALRTLVSRPGVLSEGRHVLPLLRQSPNLALLIGYYCPNARRPHAFAFEHGLFGDFRADLVVGDPDRQHYLLVEFESGAPDGVFAASSRASPVWSPRFERAFSQLIDWVWKLESMRGTMDFEACFGGRRAAFHGLIVTGKGMSLGPQERDRLRWRVDNTVVAGMKISCVSFEELLEDITFFAEGQ